VACIRPQVVNAYKNDGFVALLKAFNDTDGSYLEALTGLDVLKREAEALEAVSWSDDEDVTGNDVDDF